MEKGFYKVINDYISFGPTVYFPDGSFLSVDTVDQNTYPLDGWYYFNTLQEAKEFFKID